MKEPSGSRTSTTLLGRLRNEPADEAAWKEFVLRYGPRIMSWCRKWKLQEADAQDVTQDVLLRVATRLKSFTYDPTRSFRAWLKTLTNHALSDFVAERKRAGPRAGNGQAVQLLEQLEARDDLVQHLEEEFDQELLEEAMARVQLRVSRQNWQAFQLTAVEGLSGTEAAGRLGMKVATVFTAKSKVNKLLQEEIRRLEGSQPD